MVAEASAPHTSLRQQTMQGLVPTKMNFFSINKLVEFYFLFFRDWELKAITGAFDVVE